MKLRNLLISLSAALIMFLSFSPLVNLCSTQEINIDKILLDRMPGQEKKIKILRRSLHRIGAAREGQQCKKVV